MKPSKAPSRPGQLEIANLQPKRLGRSQARIADAGEHDHLSSQRANGSFASTAVRRELPDCCGHFSSSHSLDHAHHVTELRTQGAGSPLAKSNGVPAAASTWSCERKRSASALVLNDRMRSRPSTRQRTE